jgi:hypothetical protein
MIGTVIDAMAQGIVHYMHVEVQAVRDKGGHPIQPDGTSSKPWDFGPGTVRLPDINICVGEHGAQTCGPVPHCKDSLRCVTVGLPVSGSRFRLQVFDMDLQFNDDMGLGTCDVSQTACRLLAWRDGCRGTAAECGFEAVTVRLKRSPISDIRTKFVMLESCRGQFATIGQILLARNLRRDLTPASGWDAALGALGMVVPALDELRQAAQLRDVNRAGAATPLSPDGLTFVDWAAWLIGLGASAAGSSPVQQSMLDSLRINGCLSP